MEKGNPELGLSPGWAHGSPSARVAAQFPSPCSCAVPAQKLPWEQCRGECCPLSPLFPIQPPGCSGCSAVTAAALHEAHPCAGLGFGLWQCPEPLGSEGPRSKTKTSAGSRLWGLAHLGHSQEPAPEQTRRGHSYSRGCTRQSDLTYSGCSDSPLSSQKINRTPSDEECFFDLLSKFQSNRMDDQRCPLEECPAEAAEAAATRVPALGERICEHRCVPESLSLWE